MKWCSTCGKEIDDNAVVCVNCGAAQPNNTPAAADQGGFLWGLLGCCIPIVGLILFLVWKDSKPKTAKSAGKGALIGVIASVLVVVLYIVFVVVLGVIAGTSGYYYY